MALPDSVPVLVVGAGPVGLALALGLRARGVDVLVVDAREAPAPEVRASHMHARPLETLEGLGVVEALLSKGRRDLGASVCAGSWVLSSIALEGVETRWPFSLAIPQPEIEAIFAARLAELGGDLRRGVRVTALSEAEDHVRVETSGGVIRARWLVGCDGASSVVRAAVGAKLEGVVTPANLAMADVPAAPEGQLARAMLHTSTEGLAFRVPIRDGERVVVELPEGAIPSAEAVLAAARARIPDLPAFAQPVWWSTFKLHRLVADRFRVGRVFLAGDAAHLHSPVGGHGMNTGLLDAANLAWRLAWVERGLAHPGLLDAYEAERRPAVRLSVWQAWSVAQAMRIRRAPLRWMRDLAVRAGDPVPWVRRAIARWTLEVDADSVRGLRRAVDRQVGEGWALEPARGRLALIGDGPALDGLGDAVVRLRGEGKDVVVVRPDGLVGYRGPAAGVAPWLAAQGIRS